MCCNRAPPFRTRIASAGAWMICRPTMTQSGARRSRTGPPCKRLASRTARDAVASTTTPSGLTSGGSGVSRSMCDTAMTTRARPFVRSAARMPSRSEPRPASAPLVTRYTLTADSSGGASRNRLSQCDETASVAAIARAVQTVLAAFARTTFMHPLPAADRRPQSTERTVRAGSRARERTPCATTLV